MFIGIVGLCLFIALAMGFSGVSKGFLKFWFKNDLDSTSNYSVFEVILVGIMLNLMLGLFISGLIPDVKTTAEFKPLEMTFLTLIIVVVTEEAVFRGIPLLLGWLFSKVFNRQLYIIFGYISSIGFGLAHLANFETFTLIILSQTFSGFLYFWIGRKFGLWFAMLAHLAFNSAIYVISITQQ